MPDDTPLFKISRWGLPASLHKPRFNCWYVGVNSAGEFGMLAEWVGGAFRNSASDDNNEAMARYDHLVEQKQTTGENK